VKRTTRSSIISICMAAVALSIVACGGKEAKKVEATPAAPATSTPVKVTTKPQSSRYILISNDTPPCPGGFESQTHPGYWECP
jgi:type IV pilus biogenesis protein CpaD/CtpE